MKLIIQIPCYNEEETLPVTLSQIPRVMSGVDCVETLIVDDGSTDRTIDVARERGVHHIIRFTRHRGLASAFKAGLEASLQHGADIIVNTDADNQYAGEDIERLIRPILRGEAQVVVGARPIEQVPHFSLLKKRLQRLGSLIVSKAAGLNVPDVTSGFRAYSREAALQLEVVSDYTYVLETLIQASYRKIPIAVVPVRVNPRLRESRLIRSTADYMLRSAITILRTYFRYWRLRRELRAEPSTAYGVTDGQSLAAPAEARRAPAGSPSSIA